jgi:ABC-2 type transport system ATP-binding protein
VDQRQRQVEPALHAAGVGPNPTVSRVAQSDSLADRVGIIHQGKLVAEGTPAALKAQIGRPTLEAVPADAAQAELLEAVLSRFGDPLPVTNGSVAVRLTDGTEELADVVRGLDGEGIKVADLQVHAPTLDDVFLAKTGRSLEGAGQEADTGEHVAEPVNA